MTIDWEKTSKQACVDIIEGMQEEIRHLRVQYEERGMAMRETGNMVRSLYHPLLEKAVKALEKISKARSDDMKRVYREIATEALDEIERSRRGWG